MTPVNESRKWLERKTRKGFKGYPIATVAFYGPDNTRASKVAVGIILRADEVSYMEKWFSDETDLRFDPIVGKKIVDFVMAHKVKTVAFADRILGCPHEEGKDYPEGRTCPKCPYWAGHDRWTGQPTN